MRSLQQSPAIRFAAKDGAGRGAGAAVRQWDAGEEPQVAELLDDPVMRSVMARDNIDPQALMALVNSVRERLRDQRRAA